MILNTEYKKLWDKSIENLAKIEVEIKNRKNNEDVIKKANQILPFIKEGKEFISEFTPLDVLVINDIPTTFYKQWQIQIFESTDPIELNYIFNLIAANLSYNLIYNEEVENVLDYYNLGNEMRQMGFFSLEGNIIFFNVSIFIQQVFYTGANPHIYSPITNPQVKLQINIRPFLSIKR